MSKILYRRWPKPGERVAIPGVGERARTITGTVERVSKRKPWYAIGALTAGVCTLCWRHGRKREMF